MQSHDVHLETDTKLSHPINNYIPRSSRHNRMNDGDNLKNSGAEFKKYVNYFNKRH